MRVLRFCSAKLYEIKVSKTQKNKQFIIFHNGENIQYKSLFLGAVNVFLNATKAMKGMVDALKLHSELVL